MRVLDLFAGIGGFSLGLERVGFRTVAFCEIDRYCRAVLAKHWPGVPIYRDIRELDTTRLAADGIAASDIDVICGGFPCQDISVAGKGVGLAGPRSNLWVEMARVVGEVRPDYVIVENVSALLSRGLGNVLGDLAALGYDAEWHCIPAAAVGAPHRRDRIWIVANARIHSVWQQSGRRDGQSWSGEAEPRVDGAAGSLAYTDSGRCEKWGEPDGDAIQPQLETSRRCDADRCDTHVADAQELAQREPTNETNAQPTRGRARHESLDCSADVADADCARLAQRIMLAASAEQTARQDTRQNALLGGDLGDADCRGREHSGREPTYAHARSPDQARGRYWATEPNVGRVANGVPARVDRLRALGNALVPQIAEVIGEAIQKKAPVTSRGRDA